MRDNYATCPRGATALDPQGTRLVCGTCTGVFVTVAELSSLLAEVDARLALATDPVPLVLHPTDAIEPTLCCPSCLTAMTKHDLHGITIDRCETHGLWFDGKELSEVMSRVALAGATEIGRRERVRNAGKIIASVVGGTVLMVLEGLLHGL